MQLGRWLHSFIAWGSVPKDFSYFRNREHVPKLEFLKTEPAAIDQFCHTEETKDRLAWHYGFGSKIVNFRSECPTEFEAGSRKWYNAAAVASGADDKFKHGKYGANGDYVRYELHEKPGALGGDAEQNKFALKAGGFYQQLSDAISLDRWSPDLRPKICRTQRFSTAEMPSVSVIITFYNEPFSTLLRTVHSVLNRTPPELLEEIILVDDNSNFRFGPAEINETQSVDFEYLHLLNRYIAYMPKVKLIRQSERTGLVKARLAGIRAAAGEVITILDSHVEVESEWLENQLDVLTRNPDAVVVPTIYSLDARTFEYDNNSGIGCSVTFKWAMNEASSFITDVGSLDPIKSPVLAGGLWSMYRKKFWDFGAFDPQFQMWGAENVEFGMRMWMCGGQVLCAPCSVAYHVFRTEGAGYSSPKNSTNFNRLRTALSWLDEEHLPIAKLFINGGAPLDVGDFEDVEKFKREKQCKNFQWFLDNVANDKIEPAELYATVTRKLSLNNIRFVGELRHGDLCLDTMQQDKAGGAAGVYPCHGERGSQLWIVARVDEHDYIIPSTEERVCLGRGLVFEKCSASDDTVQWDVAADGTITHATADKCLSHDGARSLLLTHCEEAPHWTVSAFKKDALSA